MLLNPTYPSAETQLRDMQTAARTLGLQVHVLRASNEREINGVFATLIQLRGGSSVICSDPFLNGKLEVKRGTYAKPASLGDAKVSEGVNEVDWSGGNLPDAYYDEFVLTGTIGDIPAGQMMYFPVVQEYEKGVHRWIEIPATNTDREPPEPAPVLKLLPKQ